VGWYIGPSPEHYRCYKVFFPETMAKCDVLKVDFFPEKISFPLATNDDYLCQTAKDMLHLLQPIHPHNMQHPFVFGAPMLNALTKVAKLLGWLNKVHQFPCYHFPQNFRG
jgi:hypothetical protein